MFLSLAERNLAAEKAELEISILQIKAEAEAAKAEAKAILAKAEAKAETKVAKAEAKVAMAEAKVAKVDAEIAEVKKYFEDLFLLVENKFHAFPPNFNDKLKSLHYISRFKDAYSIALSSQTIEEFSAKIAKF
jgi:multidrug efflux pump subunit AcrA (membrane-fusion protein)